MIRHIVMWKLSATDPAERVSVTQEITRLLEGLLGVVPGMTSLKVTSDLGNYSTNFDLVLVSEHDSPEALQGYQDHPAHQAAAQWIRANVSHRACVDSAH